MKQFFIELSLRILRLFPPEFSSFLSLRLLNLGFIIKSKFSIKRENKNAAPCLKIEELEFRNPLGLAAGLDKEGKYFNSLGSLGFGFIEVGTFTPKPQKGNSFPRIKRLLKDKSLINRLGFNNPGIDEAVLNIKKLKNSSSPILGISIGKNKDTSLENAYKDYLLCLKKVYAIADYIAVNISSPNTKDLRKLSSSDYFDDLVGEIGYYHHQLAENFKKKIPIFLKLSPDEKDENLTRIVSSSISNGFTGFIVSNTAMSEVKGIKGGISGDLLKPKSLEILKKVKAISENSIIISCGGISKKEDFEERKDLGADLIQIYTSFVYQGPKVVNKILN